MRRVCDGGFATANTEDGYENPSTPGLAGRCRARISAMAGRATTVELGRCPVVVPRLKGAVWERESGAIRIAYDVREQFIVEDPDGAVATLLELLGEGGRTLDGLAAEFAARGTSVSAADLSDALELLDSYGLLEDERQLGELNDAERERFFSNLAFFESFASLSCSRERYQRALRESHVLVLGTGGLNSNTIPHLCGLGVGRLTLLDRDAVEPRNFARQYLYRWNDIGARKVRLAAEWVRQFEPTTKVEAVDAGVGGPADVTDLLRQFTPDLVMVGIDSPPEVDDWVDAECVPAGVPYVRGGMYVTQGLVWSVDPGVSACRGCARSGPEPEDADERAAVDLLSRRPRTNRGIGPVAGLLGSLCAFEVLRYLTRFEEPVYAGRRIVIDFAGGCAVRTEDPWRRDPDCPRCAAVRR